jgi:hypothetical protein
MAASSRNLCSVRLYSTQKSATSQKARIEHPRLKRPTSIGPGGEKKKARTVSRVQPRPAIQMGRSPGSHMLASTTATKSGDGTQPRGNWQSMTKIRTATATMIPTTTLLFRVLVVMDAQGHVKERGLLTPSHAPPADRRHVPSSLAPCRGRALYLTLPVHTRIAAGQRAVGLIPIQPLASRCSARAMAPRSRPRFRPISRADGRQGKVQVVVQVFEDRCVARVGFIDRSNPGDSRNLLRSDDTDVGWPEVASNARPSRAGSRRASSAVPSQKRPRCATGCAGRARMICQRRSHHLRKRFAAEQARRAYR